MHSNLITPPDIVHNDLHSVLIVDPDLNEIDDVIKFCQYSDINFNVYVYTPNMDNASWLAQAADASNTIIVNSRTDNYKDLCLLEKTYYYGEKNYLENQNKILDPLYYFAMYLNNINISL